MDLLIVQSNEVITLHCHSIEVKNIYTCYTYNTYNIILNDFVTSYYIEIIEIMNSVFE